MIENETNEAAIVNEARLWSANGWTARVIKSEEDDGWAVEMIKDGESEPALIGPWTMGRDKKSPKPLDTFAFQTLVKTASEVLRRHEHQLHARLHQKLSIAGPAGPISIALDIVIEDDDAYGLLSARDTDDAAIARVRVAANFKLSPASATAWIDDDFRQPDGQG